MVAVNLLSHTKLVTMTTIISGCQDLAHDLELHDVKVRDAI